jgi:hypothetical protein
MALKASLMARAARVKARAMDLAPLVVELKAKGLTAHGIAVEMTRMGVPTPGKGIIWYRPAILRIFELSGEEPPKPRKMKPFIHWTKRVTAARTEFAANPAAA